MAISKSFQDILDRAREAMRIISDPSHCVGFCEIWKYEGPRSYVITAPVVDGICTKCHKRRYRKPHTDGY